MATDLRPRLLEPGVARQQATQLHQDEKVGDTYEVWTDLLARRIAVLWVLKSVYVRVLEDRGLLSPLRIRDPESKHLFELLAPSLGDTAYLAWVFRDLASSHGGLPELFAPQPAEVLQPSDAMSRKLLALWQAIDPDTNERCYRFDEEGFDGRFLGDLYQDLDPVVKARFALLQTPDFVVDYILDLTLDPAIATFGLDEVRVLDPACGSGHFLLAAFARLVKLTRESHPERPAVEVVKKCLERVVGLDLNDYACALARSRLVMKALELIGVNNIAAASDLRPPVYWTNALEQAELEEQLDLPLEGVAKSCALLTRPEVRRALAPVLHRKFHVVVGNPPYITEKDPTQRDYHREKLGKDRKPRYLSACRTYSLAVVFTERMFQLLVEGGYMGQITANSFMKREFGKGLIKDVLPRHQLTFVVDTSGAYIPGHGTPTVLLFGRRLKQSGAAIPVLMGKRGEPSVPDVPEKGRVWTSIWGLKTAWHQLSPASPFPRPGQGGQSAEHEDEYTSLAFVSPDMLAEHPWSIGGGGAAGLKEIIESSSLGAMRSVAEAIGRTTVVGEDDAWIYPPGALTRWGNVPSKGLVVGECVRDWMVSNVPDVVYPYGGAGAPVDAGDPLVQHLWRWRCALERRTVFGKEIKATGRRWWEHLENYSDKLRTPLSITFAFKATHNHFVLDRGGKVFNRTAPVIKLPTGSTEDQHLVLLGQLNSSTGCFWLKQVCQGTGAGGVGGGIHEEEWSQRIEHDGTKLQSFPLATAAHEGLRVLALHLDAKGRQRGADNARAVINTFAGAGASALRIALNKRRQRDLDSLDQMVAWQEELDWLCYELYGLLDDTTRHLTGRIDEVPPLRAGVRPFEVRLAREDADRRAVIAHGEEPDEAPTAWFERHGWQPCPEVPHAIDGHAMNLGQRTLILQRMAATEVSRNLALIEQPTYKRRWYRPDHEQEEREALAGWLDDRIEEWARKQAQPWRIRDVVVALQNQQKVQDVAELLAGQSVFDLEALFVARITDQAVPNNKHHVFKPEGLIKRAAWEETWQLQHEEDRGNKNAKPQVPPKYGSGDYLKPSYWQHRGKLDVPKERYTAFTDVPAAVLEPLGGNEGPATSVLYGWAGWTPPHRARVLLELDEQAADAGVSLEDRYGLLYGAWFLLPYVAWTEPVQAQEFRTILEGLLGKAGVTDEMLARWATTFTVVKKREPKVAAATRQAKQKTPPPAQVSTEAAEAPRKRPKSQKKAPKEATLLPGIEAEEEPATARPVSAKPTSIRPARTSTPPAMAGTEG